MLGVTIPGPMKTLTSDFVQAELLDDPGEREQVQRTIYQEMLGYHHKAMLSVRRLYWPSPPPNSIMLKTAQERYVEDEVRTMLMMRAITRAVRKKLAEVDRDITLVEAGCGTAFLATFAANIDSRVKVKAFELKPDIVSLAKGMYGHVHADNLYIQQSDLLAEPYRQSADIVVAEHVSRGLLVEDVLLGAKAVPNCNQRDYIPYQVKPVLVTGVEVNNIWGLGDQLVFPDGGMEFIAGKDIILGGSPDQVVEIEGVVSNREGKIVIGSDICWLCPELSNGDSSFTYDFAEAMELRKRGCDDGQDDYLSAPAVLRTTYGEYYTFAPGSDGVLRISYPSGILGSESLGREDLKGHGFCRQSPRG